MVISVEQAAEMLGCKRRKVFYMLANGVLEKAPQYGREIRIYTASVEAALMPRQTKRRRARTDQPERINPENIPL